jgi:hypothetical protein
MRIYVSVMETSSGRYEAVRKCGASSRKAAERRMDCGPGQSQELCAIVMTPRQAERSGVRDPEGLLPGVLMP